MQPKPLALLHAAPCARALQAHRTGCDAQDNDDAGGNLLAAVLAILGMDEKNIKEDQSLEGMGMDSMQVLEIRTRLQRATGHPIPLEEVTPSPAFWWFTAMQTCGLTPL